jgi:hypothetical protein
VDLFAQHGSLPAATEALRTLSTIWGRVLGLEPAGISAPPARSMEA